MQTKILIALGVLVVLIGAFLTLGGMKGQNNTPIDSTPQAATISGTYECLPHANTDGPQTMECAYGIKTDQGDHYAVDFGAATSSPDAFQAGMHVRAEGMIVPKEALNSDHWQIYNMKGIFTVTKFLDEATTTNGTPAPGTGLKINIQAVCGGALAYMTFPDSKSADAFVAECVAGKHPEVIEHYKAQLNLDEGTQI